MKDLTGFRKGTVRIRVQGEQTERFLNLCKAREIKISRLIRTGDQSLEGNKLIADFFRLSPIHRKTGVKIHILEKHGLPFFFYRSKKRKAFFLGLLLCAGLLLFLSGRLWEIDVEGNVRNSTPEILDFLEKKWQPNVFETQERTWELPRWSSRMLGACYMLWNDYASQDGNEITEDGLFERFAEPLDILARKLWK